MTGPEGPREHRHTPRPGIIRITHVPSGRTHLNCSTDAPALLNRTRFELQTGTHRVPALQRDWNTDGPDSLTFELLDELPPSRTGTRTPAALRDDLKELLTLWQETLNIPPDRTA